MPQVISLLLFVAAGWLLLIRPQRQRVARHLALVDSLAVGDEVITSGGILGVVRALEDDTFQLEVAPGVLVKVAKAAVHDRKTAATAAGDSGSGALGTDEDIDG